MPEMDGYEATRLIRKSETLPRKYSNYCVIRRMPLRGEEKKCLEAGMMTMSPNRLTVLFLKRQLAKYLKKSEAKIIPGVIDLQPLARLK
jgi:CheY-like chemotaxis protein